MKGDAYEGLLEKNAQDTKSGAGQYFTPRPLIQAMVLHGIGSDKAVPLVVADALAADSGERFDVLLGNPPFGKKSSTMITGAEGKVRTEKDVTLKTNPLRREHLDEFVTRYNPANRHDRQATWSVERPEGRWRVYDYADLIVRDKASLDIFWLKDDSLANSDKLPPPDVIAQEIVDDLEAALEQFRLIAGDLGADVTEPA